MKFIQAIFHSFRRLFHLSKQTVKVWIFSLVNLTYCDHTSSNEGSIPPTCDHINITVGFYKHFLHTYTI